jgi:protein subunit release factor A
MSTVDKTKSIQGRIKNTQIAGNEFLQKAAIRGGAEMQSLIKNAKEVTGNYEDYEDDGVMQARVFLNTVMIDQAMEENKSLNQKVDWLLDAVGEILITINPQDAGKIGLKIHKLKNPE